MRQIELDLFHDPEGGRYARPAARRILKGLGKDPGPDPDQDGRLQRPGMKILHVPDVDFRPETRLAAPRRPPGPRGLRAQQRGSPRDLYLGLHPTLHGQLLFPSVPETHPQAAWFKTNDPVRSSNGSAGSSPRASSSAPAPTPIRGRLAANDPAQRHKALASGAQFISTDYPVPDPRFSPYCVQLPGRVVARANPVSGKSGMGPGRSGAAAIGRRHHRRQRLLRALGPEERDILDELLGGQLARSFRRGAPLVGRDQGGEIASGAIQMVQYQHVLLPL